MSLAKSLPTVSEKRKLAAYYMIKSLHVENFRCFQDLEIGDLQRINVVVGRNAAGKTALLEAIRLALSGTPTVLWQMNTNRGFFGGIPQPVMREGFESMWSPYFFKFDASKGIVTECVNSDGSHATVKISYDVKRGAPIIPQPPQSQPQPPVLPSSFIPPLAFERVDFAGASSTLYASVQPQGQLNFDQGPDLGSVSEFFPSSSWNHNPILASQLFSQLSVLRRERAIVDAVREEFEPSLEDLVILAPGAGQPGLYASLKYLTEKLPIGYLSAGISRFITMLSSVLIRGKGVVLIDEVENGLSYKTFPALWKYLLKFATEYDTQIFASTHSTECVKGLIPAMVGHENDFTLLRAERINGSSGVFGSRD
jgi:hypothetical protein